MTTTPPETPVSPPSLPEPPRRRSWKTRILIFLGILLPFAVFAGYVFTSYNWSYASGERAGYVQKFSKKGWICKTWEGELAMVSLPGAMPEKFLFTVRDDAVAQHVNQTMGQRVSLRYDQHKGLPTSCFGETEYFVTSVRPVP